MSRFIYQIQAHANGRNFHPFYIDPMDSPHETYDADMARNVAHTIVGEAAYVEVVRVEIGDEFNSKRSVAAARNARP